MNLFERYQTIKKQVGGNREKRSYEYTFGPTVAEKNNITEPSKYNKRILGEMNFALQLNIRQGGKYDDSISASLAVLESALKEEGVLTNSACKQAEEILLPLSKDAKSYEVLYAAHAHIDMNWMWGWQETVAVTLSTFRTMLNLMNEYPDFKFSQSQASVYQIVEEYDPEMMQEIQMRIQEGRWEVTANAWVETDKNMPDTESLLRHISVTREYLQNVWKIDTDKIKVDFSPDTFGHSRFVPEINTFGDIPYYYHCRGLQDDITLYRYKAPSGAEILMYKEPYWYNSGVNEDNGTGAIEMERRCNGLKTSLIVYGVGNHGGGATRRDIEAILEMQTWPVFPTLKFGTLHEYFEKANKVRDGLPIIDHELNAIFTGCYSTQSRIKLANRRAEAALLDAERMSALSHIKFGTEFPKKRYESAWQNVLFTHFHDILTGSCVQESREYAMGKLATAIAIAQTEQNKAYAQFINEIDTSMFPNDDGIHRPVSRSEGAGAGFGLQNYAGVPNPERGQGKTRVYTVFNPSPVSRQENVELTLWDYAGNIDQIEVFDHEGKPVLFEVTTEEPLKYWDHWFHRVLILADVPAMGYAVYAITEKSITDYPTYLLHQDRVEKPKGPIILENEKLKATFDTGSGLLQSLIDKNTREELLKAPAGLFLVHTEDSSSSAWRIGRYFNMEPVINTHRVKIQNGLLRQKVVFEQKVMDSTIYMEISLDKNSDHLTYQMEVDWHETCKAQDYIPVLSYRLPLKKSGEFIQTDVPAGIALRPENEIDVPALTGACMQTKGSNLSLICDCKYGFRLSDDVLSVTLINTAGAPDLYPERGVHNISLFVSLTDCDAKKLKYQAETLTRPMQGISTSAHSGTLKPKDSLLNIDCDHVVMTTLFVSQDDSITVRLYESAGEAGNVTISIPFEPKKAVLTDMKGRVLLNATIQKNQVSFPIEAYKIVQVKIYQ